MSYSIFSENHVFDVYMTGSASHERGNGVRAGGGPDARSRAPRPSLALGPLALGRRARGPGPVRSALDARVRLPAPRGSVSEINVLLCHMTGIAPIDS